MLNSFPVSSSPWALLSLSKGQLSEVVGGVLFPGFGHLQSQHAGNLGVVEQPGQLGDTPRLRRPPCDACQLAQFEPHFPVRSEGGPAARKRVVTHPLRARLELCERWQGSVPQPHGYPQAGHGGCVAEESTPHGFPQRFRASDALG